MQKNLSITDRLGLAEERTNLANERTMLAYIRTAIALIIAGPIIIKIFGNGLADYMGFLSILVGTFLLIIGLALFYTRKNKIDKQKLNGKLQ